jgi:hypothetical protein
VRDRDCVICRRWPTDEDHRGYRDYVRDPEHRYALAPMSFAEWLSLDEVHFDHRDQATMLDVVLNKKHADLKGEKVWYVPVERPVLALPDPSEIVDDMPSTFRTSLTEKTVEGHHTWVSFIIEGFGVSAREDRYISVHVPYDLAFDAIVLRAVTVFADAYVEKQRSER